MIATICERKGKGKFQNIKWIGEVIPEEKKNWYTRKNAVSDNTGSN